MRILVLIHPQVPGAALASHRLAAFQVASYLRALDPYFMVTCVDALALHRPWSDLCRVIVRGYDLIAVFNDFDGIDGLGRLMHYLGSLAPQASTVTFGRLSQQAPGLFKRHGFDGIVCAGDCEAGVAAFVRVVQGGARHAPGVMLKCDGYQPPPPGRFLPPEAWAMPEVDEVPYTVYQRLTRGGSGADDLAELVVPVSRGLPDGSSPEQERRYPLGFTLSYIRDALASGRFASLAFGSPHFTRDRSWVIALCEGLRELKAGWSCASTIHHLDQDLIDLMAHSGCIRISIGLETHEGAAATRSRLKRRCDAVFARIAKACSNAGIALDCLVPVGQPGSSYGDTADTIAQVLASGAGVRTVVHTPFERIAADASDQEVAWYNRHLFVPGQAPAEAAAYYALVHAEYPDPTPTPDTRGSRRVAETAGSPAPAGEHADGPGPAPVREPGQATADEREYRDVVALASHGSGHPERITLMRSFLAASAPRPGLPRGRHPDDRLERRCAAFHGVDPASAMLTAGADDAIRMICALLVPTAGRIILQVPNHDLYERHGRLCGAQVIPVPFVPADPDFISRFIATLAAHGPAVAIISNPDGYAGHCHALGDLAAIATACARHGHLLVIDEAYGDFAGISHLPLLQLHHHVIVVRSFAKPLGAAGMRIGALFAAPHRIAALARWRRLEPVSILASTYFDHAIAHHADHRRIIAEVCATRDHLAESLHRSMPEWTIHATGTDFLLVDPGNAAAATDLVGRLTQQGIRARQLGTIPGFQHHVRISVSSRRIMQDALRHLPDASVDRLVKECT